MRKHRSEKIEKEESGAEWDERIMFVVKIP